MKKMQDFLKKHRNEDGSADIVVTLFTIPFALFLILALIDVSLYMNTRASVESAVRDNVRLAGMWGGTNTGSSVRLNTTGKTTQANITARIYDSTKKACKLSHCEKAPVVKCSISGNTGKTVATKPGEPITCTVTYYYQSISGPGALLGFGNVVSPRAEGGTQPKGFSISHTAWSETGYR